MKRYDRYEVQDHLCTNDTIQEWRGICISIPLHFPLDSCAGDMVVCGGFLLLASYAMDYATLCYGCCGCWICSSLLYLPSIQSHPSTRIPSDLSRPIQIP